MSFESNIVNLNEWRYRAIVASQPPRRRVSPVVRGAGAVLMLAATAFGAYVTYAAMQFGAMTDPIVLGTLEVLGAYLLTGAVLFTGAYRLPFSRKSAATVTTASPARRSSMTEKPGTLIKFPEPAKEPEFGPLMWVRCRFCSSPFQATGPRHECPSCGRMAAA